MVELFRADISRMWIGGLSDPVLEEFRDWWVFLVMDWCFFCGEVRDWRVFSCLGIGGFFHPLLSFIEPMGWDGKIFLAAGSFG